MGNLNLPFSQVLQCLVFSMFFLPSVERNLPHPPAPTPTPHASLLIKPPIWALPISPWKQKGNTPLPADLPLRPGGFLRRALFSEIKLLRLLRRGRFGEGSPCTQRMFLLDFITVTDAALLRKCMLIFSSCFLRPWVGWAEY